MKYDTYTLEQFDEALGADRVLDTTKVVLTMTFADGKEINRDVRIAHGEQGIADAQHRPDDSRSV